MAECEDPGRGRLEKERPEHRHAEVAGGQGGHTDFEGGARPQADGEGRDAKAPVTLGVGHVLEHRNGEGEGENEEREGDDRSGKRAQLTESSERTGEVQVDADVHHAGTHDGDAGGRCRGEALEAQRRGGVGRADGERRAYGYDLDPALRNGKAGGEHAAGDYEPPGGAKAEAAGWDGQPRLVDPVDLDVLALVEADDVDVDRGTREQGQCQVATPSPRATPGSSAAAIA